MAYKIAQYRYDSSINYIENFDTNSQSDAWKARQLDSDNQHD